MSNLSVTSIGSDAEELLFKRVESKEQKQPCRQPECPPDTPLAQVHAGFRKFLKEHSSPPHSRVTAGGRIVPVGPHGSSPPSFNVSNIADVIHAQPQAPAPVLHQGPSNAGDAKGHGRGCSSATTENFSVASARPDTQGKSQQSEASFVTAPGTTGLAPVYVANFPTPLPAGAQVLVKLAHGPTLVAVGDALFEAVSEGVNTILTPLNGFQQGAQLAPAPMHPAFPPMPMMTMTSMQVGNMANNMPLAFNQPAVEVQRQALQKQLNELRTQLDQLDKYVALHRSELGSYSLSAVVAQRRQLVVQADETRVAKETLDKQTQMNSRPFHAQVLQAPPGFIMGSSAGNVQGRFLPGMGLPALGGGQQMYGAGVPIHTGMPVHNVAAQLPPSHRVESNGWKAQLSAHDAGPQSWQQRSAAPNNAASNENAAAMQSIPPGLKYGAKGWKATKTTHNFGSQAQQKSIVNNVQGSKYGPATYDHRIGAIWTHGGISQIPNTDVQGYNVTQDETLLNHPGYDQAHQQAMHFPYVSEQDASYATRLGLNPPNEPKKYCSTRAEFAEVIRQAREQARLYGRIGWSQNDLQAEAERDVRWAMGDHARIPLPKAVPEYLTNPRPWDWKSQLVDHTNDLGTTFVDADGVIRVKDPNHSAFGHPINPGYLAEAQGYAQTQAQMFRANQYDTAFGQENTLPISGPVNPGGNHTTLTGDKNGELTHHSKHAYVEDAPDTPAHYGFASGSLRGATVSGRPYHGWTMKDFDEFEERQEKANPARSKKSPPPSSPRGCLGDHLRDE